MGCVGGRFQTHAGRPAIEAKDAEAREVRHAGCLTEILASLLINGATTPCCGLWSRAAARAFTLWSVMGKRKLDDRLLRLMAKELHLSRAELLKFVECEMSYEDYHCRMIDGGHVRA
jgi:hypothetical protein